MSDDFFVYYKTEEDVSSTGLLKVISPTRQNAENSLVSFAYLSWLTPSLSSDWIAVQRSISLSSFSLGTVLILSCRCCKASKGARVVTRAVGQFESFEMNIGLPRPFANRVGRPSSTYHRAACADRRRRSTAGHDGSAPSAR